MTNYTNNPWAPSMTSDAFIPDQLIAGDLKLVTDTVLVANTGVVLPRGTLMGIVSATGQWLQCIKTATDGSQVPAGVLVDQCDTTVVSPQTTGIYLMGEFNFNAMTVDASWGVGVIAYQALKAALAPSNIFVKLPVTATDPT